MENCLKTQLKEVVNNNNLVPFEGYNLKTGVGNCNIALAASTPITLIIKGSGYFTDSTYTTVGDTTATTTVNVENNLYIKTTEVCTINIVDNYNNRYLVFKNIYAEDLGFTKYRNIINFYIQNSDVVSDNGGELFIAPLANRVEVQNDCSFKFNLAQVNNNTAIYTLALPNNNNVYGSITNLYKCTNLTSISFNMDYNVEDLAVGWLGNSKTKTCTVSGKLKKIHRSVYTQTVKVKFDGQSPIIITDNSDNTIATYDGSDWSWPNT